MAMFGGGYPMGYQQMTLPQWQNQQAMTQIQQPQITQQPMVNSTIVWVKHQKEAEDYLVAPNNSMVFMDEAMTHLYMKSADQFGRPTFTSKLLTDDTVVDVPQNDLMDKYMTKDDFAKWVDETFEKRLSELRPRNNQRSKKGANDNA